MSRVPEPYRRLMKILLALWACAAASGYAWLAAGHTDWLLALMLACWTAFLAVYGYTLARLIRHWPRPGTGRT